MISGCVPNVGGGNGRNRFPPPILKLLPVSFPSEERVDLKSIEIFLAVCDQAGFTNAAHALGLTQAAVSQQIAKLERELAITLIDRTTRPQKLTAAGEHLKRRGTSLLGDMHAILADLKHYQTYQIPNLKLGLIESVAGAMMPHIVGKLTGKVGSLSITSGTTHPLMPELLAGNFDLLITSEQPGDDEELHFECLLSEPVLLVLPKGYRTPADWDAMTAMARDLEFVRYGTRRRIGRIVNSLLEQHELETRGTLTFDSSIALLDCVRAGQSWAATTPMCLLSSGARTDDFELATFPDSAPIRALYAVWRAENDGVEINYAVSAVRQILATEIYPALLQCAGPLPDRIHLSEPYQTEDAPALETAERKNGAGY
ncbi:MAG: LysR family transcriptional regulator [Hyphomicrobiales bacterium]|nr:LysR family transcriptional regulator [Hyphomicrobiales bacterium]